MQPLDNAIISSTEQSTEQPDDRSDAEACATLVLDVVPLVMRAIRCEMRRHRAGLSVPQFRALTFLQTAAGASLSDVAEHVGLTLPSMSKLIDGLVARNLVARQTSPADRRCVTLSLTPTGVATLEAARQATRARLAELLQVLAADDRAAVVQALHALRPIFAAQESRSEDRTSDR